MFTVCPFFKIEHEVFGIFAPLLVIVIIPFWTARQEVELAINKSDNLFKIAGFLLDKLHLIQVAIGGEEEKLKMIKGLVIYYLSGYDII
ncbi:MAG: hypothetical protein M1407_00575 [Deltaproteobacteria bacterium]|nr:hypothetical protein [Deltaproteobacteria bacterium]